MKGWMAREEALSLKAPINALPPLRLVTWPLTRASPSVAVYAKKECKNRGRSGHCSAPTIHSGCCTTSRAACKGAVKHLSRQASAAGLGRIT